MRLWRTLAVVAAVTVAFGAFAAPPKKQAPEGKRLDPVTAQEIAGSPLRWYDARGLTVEGKAFADTENFWERLPARAKDKVPPIVWHLSKNTAGICVRFVTDSGTLAALWDGASEFRMNHMAPTGSAGLDLYRRDGRSWVYAGTGRPQDEKTSHVISSRLPGGRTEYMLYLPLYHKVTELKLGVVTTATLAAAPARPKGKDKPIVFYGTSITQGGCASRSGMCHTAILGRWLDTPVINLGFSGSGKSEFEMADLVNELDASVFVLEALPNMSTQQVTERLETWVRKLRDAHPHTPIILVENLLTARDSEQNRALQKVFANLRKKGVRNLWLLPGEPQLKGRENGTVDGVHPTDLGYVRMAEYYFPLLRKVLSEERGR